MPRLLFVMYVLAAALSTAVSAVAGERRLALLVGIQAYQKLPKLENTISDTKLIKEKLERAGFEVDISLDANKNELNRAIRDFGYKVQAAGPNAVALVYYAGHGRQDEKESNYLIAADADLAKEIDLPLEALPVRSLLKTIEQAKPRLIFMIIDACRDAPRPASSRRGDVRGLAPEIDLPRGLLIAYSTEPGKTAEDGPAGGHSPFAVALGEQLDSPGIEASQMFRLVSRKVLETTGGKQFPWVTQRLTEDFFFHPAATGANVPIAPPSPPPSLTPLDAGEVDYGKAVSVDTPDAYEEWLRRYPDHPRKANVMAHLQRLVEEQLWKRAEAAPSNIDKIRALDLLLSAFSNGVYAQKAKEMIAKLQTPVTAAPVPPPPPAPSYAPVPEQTLTVTRHADMDAPGNDRGQWIENIDLEKCERICGSDPGCVGYTFNVRRAVCIPKNAIGRLARAVDAAVTGVIDERASPKSFAPAPSPVRRYTGKDAPGNDLGHWMRDIRDVDACERLCLQNRDCVGYTYNIRREVCIPKAGVASLIDSRDSAITGIVLDRASALSTPTIAHPRFKLFEGMDSPGGDRGAWRRNITAIECERLCVADRGCAAYTFNRTRSTCIMKNYVNRLSPAYDSAVTGVLETRD